MTIDLVRINNTGAGFYVLTCYLYHKKVIKSFAILYLPGTEKFEFQYNNFVY